jgi:hypothetical protein
VVFRLSPIRRLNWLGLGEALGDYGDYLLSLAFAHCVSPESLRGMTEWYQKTEISNLLDIPQISYKKLVEAIDSLDGMDSDEVQERIFSRLKDILTLSPSAYHYDITNIYFMVFAALWLRKGKMRREGISRRFRLGWS